jgi:hypothetical protein
MLMLKDVPVAEVVQEVERRPRPRLRSVFRHAFVWFGLSILAVVLRMGLTTEIMPRPALDAIGYSATALFGISIVVALWGIGLAARSGAIASALGNLLLAGFSALGMLIAYVATVGFSRGRQLRRFGRVLLPRLRSSAAWTTAAVPLGQRDDVPAGLADQWRENGKTEHASVAAFARLTLDLMALGAPPTLIAAANRDALDEIRHTELCFSLAHALDGKTVSPAPFPQAQRVTTLPRSRTLALAKLAVDSLIDGALHEGVSARIIAKLAHRCEVPGIRAALKEIAADEGRHSAHGWAAVAWCLEEGGRPVAEALTGALRALPRAMRSALPEAASGGQWERWGIHGHALEAVEYAAALAHVEERVHQMAATSRQAA